MKADDFKSILMVEDDPDIQKIAKIALQSLGGYQVEICPQSKNALETAILTQPHLILLDVMMPELDGPAVLNLLRQEPRTFHIPVIFMTAKVQKDEVQNYFDMGVAGVIPKPFDPMKLHSQIRKILEGIK